ncbi:glycosyltransferase family 2 protein [Cellulomonas hominis]|uniref:glycosyltransferase family 2 protein n=1 Tax=Cellulomonas hominis TaxID=156981 RepID=UPI001443CC77|nr:glycosyltransferase family A protein [Cellulomonas hominis]NKY09166.1 glycosyltransferase family 2 protein [Cellulomonas hominis]
MAEHLTFAVVIPARDPDPSLLRVALDSVVAQTRADWECVVVDDGSRAPLSWCAGIDPRITVVQQEPGGVSSARNHGVRSTTAPWIAFLDADDEWLPRKLAVMADLMEHTDADLVYSAFYWHRPDETTIWDYEQPTSYFGLLAGDNVFPSTTVLRRDAFEAAGGFDEDRSLSEDLDLWLRLTRGGASVAREQTPLARYHTRGTGASRHYWGVWRSTDDLFRREGRLLRGTSRERAGRAALRLGRSRIREALSRQAFDAARAALAERDARAFATHYSRSWVLDPWAVTRETARWTGNRLPHPPRPLGGRRTTDRVDRPRAGAA